MSFITTKFHEILVSRSSGVVLTNCFSSIFHFCQISKFKKGHCSQKKKIESEFPVDMHIYTLCPSLLQFQEFLLSGFRRVVLTNCFSSIFHFRQISKFKKGHCSQKKKKKLNQNFLWICTSTKFQVILLSDFRGVALTNCLKKYFSFWPNF